MPPAIVQSKGDRNVSVVTFAANTTPGNLLVCLLTRRQAAAGAPTTNASWSTIVSGQFKNVFLDQENGFGIYAAICDGSRVIYNMSGTANIVCLYEISGAVVADCTPFVSKTDQAAATAIDLGSLGVVNGSSFALGMFGNGSDDTSQTVTPGAWVRDWYANRDAGTTSSNTLSTSAGYPFVWFGHQQGAGVAMEASVTIGSSMPWGGAAVVVSGTAAAKSGVVVDFGGDGFDAGSHDWISDAGNVISWTITRGAGAEITTSTNPGHLTLVTKNPSDIYNPRNASGPLYGLLRDGLPIWVGPNSDGVVTGTDPRGIFAGRVTDITLLPAGGAAESPTVEWMAVDALDWYQRTPVQLDYAEGRSHAALRLAALIEAGETRYDLAHEIQTMPLSHADGNLGSVLDAINAVNGTRHFAKPKDLYTDWYTYTTRNRQYGLDGVAAESVDAGSDHVTETTGWRLSADTVTNRQKATVTPVIFTPATFTVWQADVLPIEVTVDRPYSVIASFDDVVSGSFLNISSTGAALISVYTPFATAGKIDLSVASGTATVTTLGVEGRLARRLEQQTAQADDTTSQAAPRGIREGGEIGNEYLGVLASAKGIADHVVWRYGNPQLRPTLTIMNWLPEQFDLDLFEVIAITSSELDMTAQLFEIVGLTHESDYASAEGHLHTVTYVLQESRVQSAPHWFTLDTSELAAAGTDVLGY